VRAVKLLQLDRKTENTDTASKELKIKMITPEEKEYVQNNFKIPVDSLAPEKGWIVSLDRESAMPTEQELKQLQSFTEYKMGRTYNERHVAKLLQMPLAVEDGYDTTILRKGMGDDNVGWFYRRAGWKIDPDYLINPSMKGYRAQSLVEVMDQQEIMTTVVEKWAAWKRERPDIFGRQAEATK
jgi:hypothetical protein